MAAATVALIAGVAAGVGFLLDTGDDLLAEDGGAEVRQVVVFNGRESARVAGGQLLQTRASMPHLDLSVLNSGSDPVLLTKALVTVVDSVHLAVCEYGIGDQIPLTWNYAVELPVLPLPSQRTVSRPLHQEVPAGEVDRFKLFFRLPPDGLDDYVYALRVTLLADHGGAPLGAGRVVLGFPDAVAPNELVLPYGPEPFDVSDADQRLMSTWCARRNMAELRRVLSRPGRRTAPMSDLARMRPAGWWRDFADRRPPKAAARALLRMPFYFTEAPVLAVFAARQSGDPRFAAGVRRGAAAALLREAERSLRIGYAYAAWDAVVAARQAVLFSPSTEARELLAQAESRWEETRAEYLTTWGA
ncbi:MAG TPA: hypothetical protein VN732_01845 [Solirubrobacterales bacterium]|nr:hypothetical protein [Solirubrobacterales bacterium]